MSAAAVEARMARALRRARWAGLWEVAWRLLVPILWVLGLFVALSWLGLWTALPPVARGVALLGLAALLVAAVVAAVRRRGEIATALDADAAIRRVEMRSGLSGRELSGLGDRLPEGADSATERLWAAHRARLAARVGTLSAGVPQPDLGRRDRFALRPLLGFLLFIGWLAAPGEHLSRLVTPFSGALPVVAEDRLDAWIDPPGYTGRPPLVLATEGRLTLPAGESREAPWVPQGSRLVVRAASGAVDRPPRPIGLTIKRDDGPAIEVAEAVGDEASAAVAKPASAPIERVAVLTGDAEVTVTRDGRPFASWKISVQPDLPPAIRLTAPPEIQASGAIKLLHETEDDWGVVSAEARFAASASAKGRALFGPPSVPLSLPMGRAHAGKGRTIRDLPAHPWAGAATRMRLVARDEAGQEGSSEEIDVVLPERPFRKPTARALAELRRRLALDAGEAATVVSGLDALTLAPEFFGEKPAVHLGLRFLLRRAASARGDDALREVVDLLWVAATSIEDGDLADQEKGLRDAQEALRKALADGAPPEEIARLTRELRQAMDRWLAAKAEQGRRDPQKRAERSGPQKTITDRDLQRMLDRIEALAKTGSREAAEKLLQELRELMENLQAGESSSEGEGRAGGEALEKLGDMIRRQQKLMEDTHRSSRGEGEGDTGRLGEEQKALRDALKEFSEGMKGAGRGRSKGESGQGGESGKGDQGAKGGSGTDDDGSEDFGDAADAMGEAGEALGRGDGDEAIDPQTRALEGLRRGARKLADQMMKQNGRGGRDGEQPGDDEDPLGRPRRNAGGGSDKVKVPEEIDVERARKILEDIRKRLGEPARPRFEREYLDRLLKVD